MTKVIDGAKFFKDKKKSNYYSYSQIVIRDRTILLSSRIKRFVRDIYLDIQESSNLMMAGADPGFIAVGVFFVNDDQAARIPLYNEAQIASFLGPNASSSDLRGSLPS